MKIRLRICVIYIIGLWWGTNAKSVTKNWSTVILVPGVGSSELDARLNKPSVVHYICQKTSDWFNKWLNTELLVPHVIDCWIDNVRLVHDNITRKTYNSPGVDARGPSWGNPEVVNWIDLSHASTGKYFQDIPQALINVGYEPMKSIRGAAYDFRKALNDIYK